MFKISSYQNRIPSAPDFRDFAIDCSTAQWDDGPPVPLETIGRLSGLFWDAGFLPDKHDKWDLSTFDQRDGHAEEAASVMISQRRLIEEVLTDSNLLFDGRAFLLLERVFVKPERRGKRLALRLMREAQHVFGRYGLLVMAKAHPDGLDISSEQISKLADYYTSDEQLGFTHLSQARFPGWIVAHWHSPQAADGDDFYWEP
jgi:GNAT superfamily N-acetyltransferase